MKMETKTQKVIVVLALLIAYSFLLAPYIVHTNLTEVGTGVVTNLKSVSVQSLPKDVQDVTTFDEECTVLLIEDIISGQKTVVIIARSIHSFDQGDMIVITDKIIKWYVDWHAYQFFNEKFDLLIVGDVEQLDSTEAFIEGLVYSYLPGTSIRVGGLILSLSEIVFFVAPLILILYVSFSFKKRFYLWNLTAILALYSLEVFVFNIVGGGHDIVISDTQKYFGYLYLVLAPLTYFVAKYEEQGGIKVLYEKIAELIARLFE